MLHNLTTEVGVRISLPMEPMGADSLVQQERDRLIWDENPTGYHLSLG